MKLKVLLPSEILFERGVKKVVAEAENGAFCLEPRHIDFVAALVPGLLSCVTDGDEELFFAIDEGVLVKCGPEVLVSTRHAVPGTDLAQLKQTVAQHFLRLTESERVARSAVARLEAGIVRRFIDLEKRT